MLIEKHTQKGEKGYFFTPGKNYCGAELKGWACTRRKGHKGLHAAHRLDNIQVATWSDESAKFTCTEIPGAEPIWSGEPVAINSASEPALVSVTIPTKAELEAEIERLRAKLLRVRDWLKHAANSPGGIVAEIDEMLKLEGK